MKVEERAINSQAALVSACVKFPPGLVVHRDEAECGAEPAMMERVTNHRDDQVNGELTGWKSCAADANTHTRTHVHTYTLLFL